MHKPLDRNGRLRRRQSTKVIDAQSACVSDKHLEGWIGKPAEVWRSPSDLIAAWMGWNLLLHACPLLKESWIDEALYGSAHKAVDGPVVSRVEIDSVRLAEFSKQNQRRQC